MPRLLLLIAASLLLSACSVTAIAPTQEEIEKRIAELPPEKRDLTAGADRGAAEGMARAVERQKAESAILERRREDLAPTGQERYAPVIVTANHSLDGIWRITAPTDIMVTFNGDARYDNVGDIFCRVDRSGKAASMYCVGGGGADGELEETGERISWTHYLLGGMASISMEATLQSPTSFKGELRMRALAMSVRGVPTVGQKVIPSETDRPGLAQEVRDLLGIVARGDKGGPPGGWRDRLKLSRRDVAALGAVTQIAYVDHYERPTAEEEELRGPRHVYSVDFEKGWRLCVIRRGDDGTVALFNCR